MAAAFGCVNNTIRLRSGKYFDLADPQPDQFEFADIAGALSKICRFGSQCDCFYSVAEHLVHCKIVASMDGAGAYAQAHVLMHDAAEAFVGDMVKPLKMMLPQFQEIESRVEAAIEEKWSLNFAAYSHVVKEIDQAMLIAERRHLFSRDCIKWTGEDSVRVLDVPFHKWCPIDAEKLFTDHAAGLGIK